MKSLEFLAMFIAPVFGTLVMNYKYNYKTKELCLNYLGFLALTNLLTNLGLFIFRDYIVYDFTISLFVKYSFINIILSILLSLIIITVKENVKFTLSVKKNEKK